MSKSSAIKLTGLAMQTALSSQLTCHQIKENYWVLFSCGTETVHHTRAVPRQMPHSITPPCSGLSITSLSFQKKIYHWQMPSPSWILESTCSSPPLHISLFSPTYSFSWFTLFLPHKSSPVVWGTNNQGRITSAFDNLVILLLKSQSSFLFMSLTVTTLPL